MSDKDGHTPFSLIEGRTLDTTGERLQKLLLQRGAEEQVAAHEQQMREVAEEMTTAFHAPVDMRGKTMSPLKFRGHTPA